MRMRASGFCIYNDVALAVASRVTLATASSTWTSTCTTATATQALFWDDPAVLDVVDPRVGPSLFPGTGWPDETGGPAAPGTSLNTPLEAGSGDASWWPIVELVLPALADAFGPTMLVSQHGCDSHALDPLGAPAPDDGRVRSSACALLDEIAHRFCEGRWLATGGGGYDAYRVVPRSWALVWLAQAHRPVPAETPPEWRARWARAGDRLRAGAAASAAHRSARRGRARSGRARGSQPRRRAEAALEHVLGLISAR